MTELVNVLRDEGRLPSPVQLRAARAALNWSSQKLADQTGLGVNTIKRAEAGGVRMTAANSARLIEIFSQNGIGFVSSDDGRIGILVEK